MAINSFILVNKETGVTLYTKSYTKLQSEEEEILFSGALMAIQGVMEEVRVGKVKEINTEEYRIITSTSDRFALFCVGEFSSDANIKEFLDKTVNLLESWIVKDEYIQFLDEQTEHILEAMYDEFVQSFKEDIVTVSIFAKDSKFGFQPLLKDTLPHNLEIKMVGYLSGTKQFDNETLFFEYTPQGNAFLGYRTTTGYYVIVNFVKLIDLMLILSFKHLFPITMQVFIPDLSDFVASREEPETVEQLFELIDRNIEDIFDFEFTDLGFLGNETLLEKFSSIIPEIITKLITGHPVALLENDNNARDLLNLIAYVSGIKSTEARFLVDYPHRFVLANEEDIPELIECGYAIIKPEQYNTINHKGYVHKIWNEAMKNQQNSQIRDITTQMRDELQHIFDVARSSIVQAMYGINPEVSLNTISDAMQKELIEQVINWINPNLIHVDNEPIRNNKEIVW